jgi:N-acetylmuramoyl-L-alanine amidase
MAMNWRPSPNHGSRGDPARIDMLVLHYTGMQSAAAALDRLCDPTAKVSAHYVVEETGAVWQLVRENRRAFHAGVSCWQGEYDLNLVSIGVEIVNPGHDWGYRLFPEAQMVALERLCRGILSRHPIPADRVVGHSDIAPDRKSDPGELFDWPRLARGGVGLWPEPGLRSAVKPIDRERALADLAAIGYCTVAEVPAIAAFQRRFRPASIDGFLDRETTLRLAEVGTVFSRTRAERTGNVS